MTKNDYIMELSDCLQNLDPAEASDILDYVNEYLQDAEDPRRAMEELGSPRDYARKVLEDLREETETSPVTTPPFALQDEGGARKRAWIWGLLTLCGSLVLGVLVFFGLTGNSLFASAGGQHAFRLASCLGFFLLGAVLLSAGVWILKKQPAQEQAERRTSR